MSDAATTGPVKVAAEGSVWRLGAVGLLPEEVAEKSNAVKATWATSDIWRLYFPEGSTPSEGQIANMLGISAKGVTRLVPPTHLAMVTPTER